MTDTAVVQVVALLMVIATAPGLVTLGLHLRGLGRRVGELESLRLLDAAERVRLQYRVDELEHGVSLLLAQIRRMGAAPEWVPSPAGQVQSATGQLRETNELVALWQKLDEHFSVEEMRDVLFELKLSDFRADTSEEMARKLVLAAKRHRRLDDLRSLARRERPEGGF